ncbi:hypothetical protein MKEN_01110500 [Mycena kentingensis (nom. inval.)]|nr:hypothetical protein MKEN_01110500 [Mycena kentingensis (nom. inval.)]
MELTMDILTARTWAGLTSLKIIDMVPATVLGTLRETPALVHCWASFWVVTAPSTDTPVHVPHLQTLILEAEAIEGALVPLMERLEMPRLARLAIKEELTGDIDADIVSHSLARLMRMWGCAKSLTTICFLDVSVEEPLRRAIQSATGVSEVLVSGYPVGEWHPPEEWGTYY